MKAARQQAIVDLLLNHTSLTTEALSGDPFHIRLKSHYAHKADIAREALAWIEEGMVIALDASSTCWYLARQLPDINIQVFTNSHPICQIRLLRQSLADFPT